MLKVSPAATVITLTTNQDHMFAQCIYRAAILNCLLYLAINTLVRFSGTCDIGSRQVLTHFKIMASGWYLLFILL